MPPSVARAGKARKNFGMTYAQVRIGPEEATPSRRAMARSEPLPISWLTTGHGARAGWSSTPGSWLTGRMVLLHPAAIGEVDHEHRELSVGLTRAQVEGSPELSEHQPVSMQMERHLYDYYGWEPMAMEYSFGANPIASKFSAPPFFASAPAADVAAPADDCDPHLRSLEAIKHYSPCRRRWRDRQGRQPADRRRRLACSLSGDRNGTLVVRQACPGIASCGEGNLLGGSRNSRRHHPLLRSRRVPRGARLAMSTRITKRICTITTIGPAIGDGRRPLFLAYTNSFDAGARTGFDMAGRRLARNRAIAIIAHDRVLDLTFKANGKPEYDFQFRLWAHIARRLDSRGADARGGRGRRTDRRAGMSSLRQWPEHIGGEPGGRLRVRTRQRARSIRPLRRQAHQDRRRYWRQWPGGLLWGVVAATSSPGRGALAGEYVGPEASAKVGVGVGAAALVGGSNGTFSLQPLNVEGGEGIGFSAGVESLTLAYVADRPAPRMHYRGRHHHHRHHHAMRG